MKMKPPRKTAANPGLVGTKGPAVDEFVGVLGELKALIAEENELLSQGLPASMLDTGAQKGQLSAKYGALGNNLVDRSAGQILSDAALQEKLLAATTQLFAMTEENRQLLCNALAATRRRVDNVMDAIRTCEDNQSPNGSAPLRRR
jgi:hypothetical protein